MTNESTDHDAVNRILQGRLDALRHALLHVAAIYTAANEGARHRFAVSLKEHKESGKVEPERRTANYDRAYDEEINSLISIISRDPLDWRENQPKGEPHNAQRR